MIFAHSLRRLAKQSGLLLVLASFGSAASHCDLNQDGVINVLDVQLITNMVLGTATCTNIIAGTNLCTSPVRTVVINGVFGGGCHAVSLSWTASSSSNVVGYNVYRSTTSGGPYTLVSTSPVAATTYIDPTVSAGQTYYYVVTSVDSSNNESAKSTQISATVSSTAS